MASFNKIILVGRLTRDVETTYAKTGTQIAKFAIAVNRTYKKDEETDFFPVTAFGKLAEICGQYLKKGSQVLLEGSLHTRHYETQDGQKRTAFEVVASNMQMLDSKKESGGVKEAKDTFDADVVDVDEFEDLPF